MAPAPEFMDELLPDRAFEALGISRGLCKVLEDLGISAPSDIQRLAIPPLLAGQDLIGIAPTGTGKTLAYLLPIVQALRTGKVTFTKGPAALIVVPARELAQQVASVLQSLLADDLKHQIAVLFGGTGATAQKAQMEAGPCIVVGTPGRIQDFYLQELLVLKQVKFLVLDEADRLMDMGFMPQLRAMLEVLPRKRQNLLFSATFSHRVEVASAEFLEWPIKVQAAKQATVPKTIEERFYLVPNKATKLELLEALWQQMPAESSAFVFCRSRQDANHLLSHLNRNQTQAVGLHANKGQNVRTQTLEQFRTGEARLLVTTDVTSRGLDIPDVPFVFQMNLPLDIRDYVHRTGRTGRAGALGISISFIDPGDEVRLSGLAKLLGHPPVLLPLPADVPAHDTPREEAIEYERIKDDVRKAADPTFKGAFHVKQTGPKRVPKPKITAPRAKPGNRPTKRKGK